MSRKFHASILSLRIKAELSNRNIMLNTYVILDFLAAATQKSKKKCEINF